MAVDRQRRMPTQRRHGRKAAPVQTDHHAIASLALHEVGVAQHLAGLVRDVEGHHHLLARAFAMRAHRRHDRRYAFGQRCMHGVGADLVVLDEVDARVAQARDERGRLVGAHAHVGFEDRANERALCHARGPARTFDAVAREFELPTIGQGHRNALQAHAGDFPQVVQVACQRGGQRGQIRAHVVARKRDAHPCTMPRSMARPRVFRGQTIEKGVR